MNDMFRIGHGSDIHRLEAGKPLVLGGVSIDSDLGAVGIPIGCDHPCDYRRDTRRAGGGGHRLALFRRRGAVEKRRELCFSALRGRVDERAGVRGRERGFDH